MSKTFESWDATTRNLIGAYETEDAALRFVHAYLSEHGPSYPESWILLWDDDAANDGGAIAERQMLVAQATAHADKASTMRRPPGTAKPLSRIGVGLTIHKRGQPGTSHGR